ncbi:hypothetical protein KSP40_PGU013698 [Platanthera guangdongensis]|uniref:Uncharacterized protein n=1 Tax=Platanthera guangdongensis TaxID=2320717 RepID=A0ABR2N307_9ASPA
MSRKDHSLENCGCRHATVSVAGDSSLCAKILYLQLIFLSRLLLTLLFVEDNRAQWKTFMFSSFCEGNSGWGFRDGEIGTRNSKQMNVSLTIYAAQLIGETSLYVEALSGSVNF